MRYCDIGLRDASPARPQAQHRHHQELIPMKRKTLEKILELKKHYESLPAGYEGGAKGHRHWSLELSNGKSYPLVSVTFGLNQLPKFDEGGANIPGIHEVMQDIVMIKPTGDIPQEDVDFIICDVDDIVSATCTLKPNK
jgi:hypothetical protein